MKEHKSGNWDCGLSEEEKLTLLAIARDTLSWAASNGKTPFNINNYKITEKLKEPFATFVTLKTHGDLRGCIGSLAPGGPLYMSVHENAEHAALHDTRFQPVRPEEIPSISIAVSILSPVTPIASIDEFKTGQHGIILTKGMRRSVFLPEVAVEQGWGTEETLTYLSSKAGLPPDAWKKDASFQVFQSVVLEE